MELPPRLRGRPTPRRAGASHEGTTPASAGTTNLVRQTPGPPPGELPPRLRGRQHGCSLLLCSGGTTPAPAGTTSASARPRCPSRNYPRVCGDDDGDARSKKAHVELPPRLRGRPPERGHRQPRPGTTPASAGTTSGAPGRRSVRRNYPRFCGDDPLVSSAIRSVRELPPRLRGRHPGRTEDRHQGGTTPASAGTTVDIPPNTDPLQNYPRVRGDDTC